MDSFAEEFKDQKNQIERLVDTTSDFIGEGDQEKRPQKPHGNGLGRKNSDPGKQPLTAISAPENHAESSNENSQQDQGIVEKLLAHVVPVDGRFAQGNRIRVANERGLVEAAGFGQGKDVERGFPYANGEHADGGSDEGKRARIVAVVPDWMRW